MLLKAKQAKDLTDQAKATDTDVSNYVEYILSEVKAAVKNGEYSITFTQTRNSRVTAKAIDQLISLGYSVDPQTNTVFGTAEITISWDHAE